MDNLLWKYKKSVLFLLLLLAHHTFFGQNDNKKILAEAVQYVYENPDSAIAIGMEIYKSPESTTEDKINALMLASTGHSSKREYEKSLELAIEAKTYFPKLNSDFLKINILNRIGSQYQQLDIYDKAIDYFDEALELTKAYPNKDSIAPLLGYNYAARGFIYREQMSCDIALDFFDKALEYYKTTLKNPMMNANMSIIAYNKGNCFIALNQIEKAKTSFQNAIDYAKVLDAKSLIAFGQKGLAEVNTLNGNYAEAIVILKEAEEISGEVGDLVLNQGIFKALSDNYLAIKEWEKYKTYFDKYAATVKQIEVSEQNTINKSIENLINEKQDETAALKSKFLPLKMGLGILIFATAIGLFFIIKNSKNKLNAAKNNLQILKINRKS